MAGILRDRPVVAKVRTILLTWDSAKFMREYEHRMYEHGKYANKPLSDKHIARMKRDFDYLAKDGFREYTEDSFGYFVDDKWRRITIDDVARLLKEQGLDYKIGGLKEVIYL